MNLDAEITRPKLRPVLGVFVPVTAAEREELEAIVGRPMPDDYFEFVSRIGRTGFEHGVAVRARSGEALHLLELFGGRCEGRVDDVFRGLTDYDDVLTSTEVVIGDDVFGNPFVLDFGSGAVSFLDFEFGSGRRDVAGSFSEFLGRVAIVPE